MKPVAVLAVEVAAIGVASTGAALADVNVSEGALTGGAVATAIIIGREALSWYLRVRKDTTDQRVARTEADERSEDKQAARDRKARRDALDEYRQVLADVRSDRDADREVMHGLRGELQLVNNRLALCERERDEFRARISKLEEHERERP